MVNTHMRCKRSILSVGRAKGHLPIACRTVQGRKDFRISLGVQAILHSRNGISILLGDVVESSVVDTEAGLAILLWYDDDEACPGTVARFYNLGLQHLVDS